MIPASDAFDVLSSQTVTEHEVFYFFDGNIVLSAKKYAQAGTAGTSSENETEASSQPVTVLFRVHKSICSVHSFVFARMIQEASESVSETYDNVPLVEMPDSADEIEAMLEVMYGLSEWKKHSGTKNSDFPLLVENLMAMATKYEIQNVRQEIIDAMHRDWPFTLSEWDALHPYVEDLGDPERRPSPLPEPAAAAVFARRFDIPQLRAVALHALSCTDARQCPDGSRLGRCARWDLLSKEDYRALSFVQELHRDLRRARIFDSQTCTDVCRSSHNAALNDEERCVRLVQQRRDSLTTLHFIEMMILENIDISGACKSFDKTTSLVKANRIAYWRALLVAAGGDKAFLHN